MDPQTLQCEILTKQKKGWVDGAISESAFNEPVDICLQNRQLFVVDRGNHVVRIVTLGPDDAAEVQSLRQQRQTEAIVENEAHFQIFCRACQLQCGFGNDQTCNRCGSSNIIVIDANGLSEKLASSVIFKGDSSLESSRGQTTRSRSASRSLVQQEAPDSPNAIKSKVFQPADEPLNVDSLQTVNLQRRKMDIDPQVQRVNESRASKIVDPLAVFEQNELIGRSRSAQLRQSKQSA